MEKTRRNLIIVIVIGLVIIAGVIGWAIGHSGNASSSNGSNNKPSSSQANSGSTTAANSLVSYSLPAGWQRTSCPSASGVTYVIPSGASLNCAASPSAPISIATDPQNTTDCNQLKVNGVLKHTCISLYIDGHKSLKSFTQTKQSSSLDYYVNTGNGVVKLDYTYAAASNYQAGFQAIINSLKVKT